MENQSIEKPIYFESHVTIEPCFDERLEELKLLAKKYHFRVADLLMQKRKTETPTKSVYDTFCTGRSLNFDELYNQMMNLVQELQSNGYSVWRYKIESVLLDVRVKEKQKNES